jgi:hypothetical protein
MLKHADRPVRQPISRGQWLKPHEMMVDIVPGTCCQPSLRSRAALPSPKTSGWDAQKCERVFRFMLQPPSCILHLYGAELHRFLGIRFCAALLPARALRWMGCGIVVKLVF